VGSFKLQILSTLPRMSDDAHCLAAWLWMGSRNSGRFPGSPAKAKVGLCGGLEAERCRI
jgi:hypothetical protein